MASRQIVNLQPFGDEKFMLPKLPESTKKHPSTIKGIVGEAISFFAMHQTEKQKGIFETGLKITQFPSENKYNSNSNAKHEEQKKRKKEHIFPFQKYIKRYNYTYYPQANFLHQARLPDQYPCLTNKPTKDKKKNQPSPSKILKVNQSLRKKKSERESEDGNQIWMSKMIRSESILTYSNQPEAKKSEADEVELNEPSFIKQLESNLKNKEKNKFQIKNPNSKKHRFYIGSGNNEQLVKEIITVRKSWQETAEYDTLFNLRWQSSTSKVWYNRIEMNRFKQYVNHLEFHQEITSKCGLLKTLRKHCSRHTLNCFDIFPVSFVFDIEDIAKYEAEMKKFVFYFCENMPNSDMRTRKERQYVELIKNIPLNHKANLTFQSVNLQAYGSLNAGPYIVNDHYLWIFKPSEENRGRGIRIFRTLPELIEIINTTNSYPVSTLNPEEKLKKSRQFIIQKYIERPLLIHERKFDIRVWLMVGASGQIYFFKEGYIRTSSQQFMLEESSEHVHLTNNAIQKTSEKYGLYEEGNQLTFDDFDRYFQETNPEFIPFRQTLLPKIKDICRMVMDSSTKKIRNNKNECCFEIFGFDYMVDEKGGLWLIEVNTNPSLQTNSKMLERMVPRMLDDAFRMVLDPIFKSKRDESKVFPLEGYDCEENVWELLKIET